MSLRHTAFILAFIACIQPIHMHAGAVTYQQWGGRLGDQLMLLCKAAWVGYCHDIPLLLRPVKGFEKFALTKKLNRYKRYSFSGEIDVKAHTHINAQSKKAHVVNFRFKDQVWDDAHEVSTWHNLMVDGVFRNYMRTLLTPIKPVKTIALPDDRISVAVHVRTIEPEFDLPVGMQVPVRGAKKNPYENQLWLLKFPSDQYYSNQIIHISELYDDQPLYVHILTNYDNPADLVECYKKTVNKPNITYGYSAGTSMLDDMFAITHCSCLIRSSSQFAQVAQLLGDHTTIIYPKHAVWDGGTDINIDDIGIIHTS